MAKALSAHILGIACFFLAAAMGTNEATTTGRGVKTEIVIIGTLHEYHFQNELYRPEVLREILLALKPDVLRNEPPSSQLDQAGEP